MLFRIIALLGFGLFVTSCGANVQKTDIKTFVMGLKQGDQAYKPLIKRMIDDYNTNLGYRVLEFSDSMDTANSPVLITKGLEAKDGKVGWGQWFSSTERRGATVPVPGTKSSETTRYSLQVEFDEDFLTSNNKDTTNGGLNMEIRKLFAHEVGHGFQMQHAPQEKEVMYYDISGDKDFSTYWPQVRNFFGIN